MPKHKSSLLSDHVARERGKARRITDADAPSSADVQTAYLKHALVSEHIQKQCGEADYAGVPWRASPRPFLFGNGTTRTWIEIAPPAWRKVAWVRDTHTPQGQANLRLLASAPVLYRTLLTVRSSIALDTRRNWRRELDEIEKATAPVPASGVASHYEVMALAAALADMPGVQGAPSDHLRAAVEMFITVREMGGRFRVHPAEENQR